MTEAAAPDLVLMRRAIALAQRARPSPNPRVGALVAADGEIVGEGFHAQAGLPHAEIVALRAAGERARGADLYVTLEPCCHAGRTGPCTEAIHAAGIRRVVVGMIDPDRNVCGGGVAWLERNGHEVIVGPGADECRRMLDGYVVHRTRGRPLVRLKAAVSLDGALAAASGDSRWISGPESRARAHALRAEADAVLVGVGTVLADDPELSVRHVPGESPLRVVLDPALRTPPASRLLGTATAARPVLLVHAAAGAARAAALAGRDGVETMVCAVDAAGRIDPAALLAALAARGVLSLLVEGGAQVLSAFAAAGLADRFSLFLAPKLIGSGRSWIALPGVARVADAVRVRIERAEPLGGDLLLEGSFGDGPAPGV